MALTWSRLPMRPHAVQTCSRSESFFCAWRYSLGFSISASSDSVAKEDKPRSMPTAAFVSGSGCTEVSTAKQTYQCSHSRLTETVLHLAVQRAMQLHFDVADALHEP